MILEKLGTNLSAVVNMLIKQIIITEGIPFEVKLGGHVYSAEEAVNEVRATMAFENMDLTEEGRIRVKSRTSQMNNIKGSHRVTPPVQS